MSLEPTLSEVIRDAIESRLLDLHVALPGRVKSYDPATQRADVRIAINRATEGSSGRIVSEEYPVIPNVPVGWTRGGGYSFQCPLEAGDHVLLVFSEAAISQWRVTGDISDPGDLERHGLSYPIAIPCIAPDAEPLPSAASGALVTTPSGGALSVSEAGGAPEPVAIASKVQANHEAILGVLTGTYAVTPADGGAAYASAFKAAAEAVVLQDVASSNLQAE